MMYKMGSALAALQVKNGWLLRDRRSEKDHGYDRVQHNGRKTLNSITYNI